MKPQKREEKYGTAGNADLPSHLPKPDTEHDRSALWYLPLNIHHTTLETETWLRIRYFLFCQESLKKKKGVRGGD